MPTQIEKQAFVNFRFLLYLDVQKILDLDIDAKNVYSEAKNIMYATDDIEMYINNLTLSLLKLRIKASKWKISDKTLEIELIENMMDEKIERLFSEEKIGVLSKSINDNLESTRKFYSNIINIKLLDNINLEFIESLDTYTNIETFKKEFIQKYEDKELANDIFELIRYSLLIGSVFMVALVIMEEHYKVSDQIINDLSLLLESFTRSFIDLAMELKLVD